MRLMLLRRNGTFAAEDTAKRLVGLGWRRQQTYGDGVIRLTRGRMSLFVGSDGKATRPATEACMIEYARLGMGGIEFKG